MKRRYTNTEKVAGEQAVRRMSKKAKEFYSQTDPLNVYEYDSDETKKYAYTGVFEADGLSFSELEKDFEEFCEIMEE